MCVVIVVTFVWVKCKKQRSWEYLSVLTAIYLVKGGMLIGQASGPAFYTCLFINLYCVSLIVKGNVNKQGEQENLFLTMFYIYWLIEIGFYRTSHRENFTSIQYGKVCPGGLMVNDDLHWILIFFELLTPVNVPLFMLPLLVQNSHIPLLNTYSQAKKDDEKTGDKPAPKTPARPQELKQKEKGMVMRVNNQLVVQNKEFSGAMP